MTTQTGPEYIKHCRKLGFGDAEISAEMRRVGWQDLDLKTAFAQVDPHTGGAAKNNRLWVWITVGIIVIGVLGALGVVAYYTLFA